MNLLKHYHDTIVPELMKEIGYKNVMAVPSVKKVVLNIGIKEAAHDKGSLERANEQLMSIAGQKPKVTKAKKSIANFKLREGDAVGLTTTLRGKRMYDFMTKLFTIVLPRVRDFHGVPLNAFDHQGNYTLGFSEQIAFSEIDYSKIDKIRGLEVTFVIKNGNAKIAKLLLSKMGMPFAK